MKKIYEIEDLVMQNIRIERKLDVLLALNELYVDDETLEVKKIEEDTKEEISNDDSDDIQIKEQD